MTERGGNFPQLRERKKLRNRRIVAGVSLVAAFGLAGCDPFKTNAQNIPPVSAEFNQAYDSILYGSCAPDSRSSSQNLELAAACKTFLTNGSIALVDFNNLTPDQEQGIITETQTLLHQATGGLFVPNLTVIDATQEAIDQFNTHTADCTDVERGNEITWASVAADITMQDDHQLHQFNAIIALSSQDFCRETVSGATNPDTLRHVDIAPAPYLQGTVEPVQSETTTGEIIAHEILHLSGLGEAHALSDKQNPPQQLSFENGIIIDDLQQYLIDNTLFYSYGDTNNLMGSFSSTQPDGTQPEQNQVQLDILRTMTEDYNRQGKYVEGMLSINYNRAPHENYALVPLATDIGFGQLNYLNELAIVPKWENGTIQTFELTLVDTRSSIKTTLAIGTLGINANSDAENVWTFTHNSQTIQISFNNNSLSVSTTTT